jgi:hypothetical protein
MEDKLTLGIAGLQFSVSCDDEIELKELQPVYKSFSEKAGNGESELNINVSFELGEMPSTENHTKIFQNADTWSLYRDDEWYYLKFFPHVFNHPLWLAKASHDFTKITVFCGEKLINRKNDKTILSNPLCYPLDQLLLIHILSQHEGALIHCACTNINGMGFIFPGRSRAGKSTLMRQFAGIKDVELLTDDRAVVRKINDSFKAYGTPWPGEEDIALNKSVPLSDIFFISHSPSNTIHELSPQKALKRLLPVTSIPWYHPEIMHKVLDFCEDLILNIPAHELRFKPTVEVVDVLKDFAST